eukprot:620848-Prorocentrum_minimum.AAC.2
MAWLSCARVRVTLDTAEWKVLRSMDHILRGVSATAVTDRGLLYMMESSPNDSRGPGGTTQKRTNKSNQNII